MKLKMREENWGGVKDSNWDHEKGSLGSVCFKTWQDFEGTEWDSIPG